ncbi:transposase and inactivated derivatives [Hymenobacter roseosalivarius DSM 11622]|uniref:Transposase and inactivated derivatives n=1 Tax=Hymenobacter roseosalivarius DSM 11622 TaxID=645990 RepID=A0A1W1W4H2_9BACT|nr:helix-turn-helix domain-containing protein [Hymenobacter roseosalivarius]SMC00413.1 transposase and inactivated derivatives [Hymenobacter roseosalivarius DSM 11622]
MGRPITPLLLSATDRTTLESLPRKGRHAGRTVPRGRVLLRLADGVSGYKVAAELGCCVQTVYQVRRRYAQQGLATALGEASRSGGPRCFDGAARAALTALACTPAPTGHSRWPLRLLADKAVELCLVATISHETMGQVLKKTRCSPTASSTGVWAR